MVQVHSESRCKPFCTPVTGQQRGTAEHKDGADRESVKKKQNEKKRIFLYNESKYLSFLPVQLCSGIT